MLLYSYKEAKTLETNVTQLLEKLVKQSGLDQTVFAETIGLKKAAFNNYIKGRRDLPKSVIVKLMEVYNVNPAAFFDADAPIYIESSTHNVTPIKENTTEIKTLPLYGNVAAGAIAEIEGVDVWNVETIDIPSVMLGRYANDDHLFSMYVNGDSMDKVIPSGSIIAVKTLEDNLYKDGDIVIFSHHGEYSLKRYRPSMIEGFVIFEPDSNNPDFKNIPINNSSLHEANEVSIYGKVIFYSTTL